MTYSINCIELQYRYQLESDDYRRKGHQKQIGIVKAIPRVRKSIQSMQCILILTPEIASTASRTSMNRMANNSHTKQSKKTEYKKPSFLRDQENHLYSCYWETHCRTTACFKRAQENVDFCLLSRRQKHLSTPLSGSVIKNGHILANAATEKLRCKRFWIQHNSPRTR